MNEMISLHPEATHLTGYWSGKTVQVNNTDKILLLKESLTTANVIGLITSFHNLRVSNWLNEEKSYFKFEEGRTISTSIMYWETLPSFADDLGYYNNKTSPAKTFRNLCERLGDKQSAIQEIHRVWIEEGLPKGFDAFRASPSKDLKDGHATMLLGASRLAGVELDSLLTDLLAIHNAALTHFAVKGFPPSEIFHLTNVYLLARDKLLSSPAGFALKRLFPEIYAYLSKTDNARAWKVWRRLRRGCSQWLLLGAWKNYWLLPKNSESFTAALSSLLNEPDNKFGDWDILLTKQSKTPPWLASLYARSTLRNIDDTPTHILEHIPLPSGWKTASLKSALKKHNNARPFPLEMLDKRTRNVLKQNKIYSEKWAEETLSPTWACFFKLWHLSQPNLSQQDRGKIFHLLEWCKERGIEDPWAITSVQLYNVYVPDDQTDFYHYLKKAQQETGNPKSDLAVIHWTKLNTVFNKVVNQAKLPDRDADLITTDNPANPFEGLPQPFKRKNSNGNKTPRSRLLSELQEELVEELLGLETQQREVYLPLLDEKGQPLLDDEGYPVLSHEPTLIEVKVPTFSWAKKWSEESTSTGKRYKTQSPEWYERNGVWHWNPSASVALAILLLVPLRGKQVRWLDQGLLDPEVFELSSGRMIENTHPLGQFRYANGENQKDFYGSLSGVLQVHSDELNGAMESVIWSSTNKTALWDGVSRTGYALPWPDGQALMLSDDEEIRKRGQQLARVYEVLRYQHEYMAKHDPNPSPMNFSHVSEDKKDLPVEEHLHQNLPWFVPLCRQLGNEVNVTWPNGEVHRASQPVSKGHIEKLYNALCLHVEKKLRKKDKRLANVSLTVESKTSTSVKGHKARYDIHSLRVAGISRLIELGVPAHLVSEYIAGHQTVVMTMNYFQTTPMHMRKQLMEALLNGDIIDGFEAVVERLANANANANNGLLPPGKQSRDHAEDLPIDFAAIAPVPGGICLMGGEGSRCDVCAVKYREDERGQVVAEYVQQLGGCAGGRFYRTGPDFNMQQALEANKLMVLLRQKARERKAAIEELKALNDQIRELEMDIEMGCNYQPLAKMQKQLDNLKLRHRGAKNRLNEMNELQAPLIAQWYQRWQDFTDSKELEAELANEEASGQMVLIGDSEYVDFTPEIAASNDFGLVRTVLEQALCYKRTGITMPEDCRMLVDQFLNRIFAIEDPQLLMLFNQPRSAQEQDYLSGMLANLVSTVFGDDKVQLASEGGLKLGFNSELKESVKALCEKPSLLAMPDHRGKFSNLQPIEIRVEQSEAESPALEHF
ncbi:VPA1269 family protein [Photobacterium lipolyticum]|uniref:Integrase n=1 Tax=Photobacterium lipolyticum TaxID=266810 RepID=A0A2T3MW35_9GAMM|nr:VPA1269 family protein [Photobacterium lipolyticum]PSW04182.1 hypothetical protein C9I89_14485 [Photobacterium lipolyticum]